MLIYVLVMPLFMMEDYDLTLLGQKLSKEYREHYVTKGYEYSYFFPGECAICRKKTRYMRHWFK